MSEHFERALADWREARAEYENVLHADYEAAAEACRDRLVNARGRRLGIDPMSLFMGNRARAYAYASEELIEWWETHPRTPFVEFERAWIAQRDAEIEHEIEQRTLADPWTAAGVGL
ncbi:hypothetical protein SEA_ANTUNA_56 [Microbacterium phage Antuna]|nr:hypothetical protein SEA_BLETT_54 [Microbacterium phage Blett]URM87318.1 hypothetical protein SEA_ANTUNA_56 [Microbacterium phage Antuna]